MCFNLKFKYIYKESIENLKIKIINDRKWEIKIQRSWINISASNKQ